MGYNGFGGGVGPNWSQLWVFNEKSLQMATNHDKWHFTNNYIITMAKLKLPTSGAQENPLFGPKSPKYCFLLKMASKWCDNPAKSGINGIVQTFQTRYYYFSTEISKYHAIGTHNNPLLGLKHDFSLKMATICHKNQKNHKLMGFYKYIRHTTNISVQKNQNFRPLDTTIAHNNLNGHKHHF